MYESYQGLLRVRLLARRLWHRHAFQKHRQQTISFDTTRLRIGHVLDTDVIQIHPSSPQLGYTLAVPMPGVDYQENECANLAAACGSAWLSLVLQLHHFSPNYSIFQSCHQMTPRLEIFSNLKWQLREIRGRLDETRRRAIAIAMATGIHWTLEFRDMFICS